MAVRETQSHCWPSHSLCHHSVLTWSPAISQINPPPPSPSPPHSKAPPPLIHVTAFAGLLVYPHLLLAPFTLFSTLPPEQFFQNTYVVWDTGTERLSRLPEAAQKAVAQTGRQGAGLLGTTLNSHTLLGSNPHLRDCWAVARAQVRVSQDHFSATRVRF